MIVAQYIGGILLLAAIIWYFGFGAVVAFITICALILAGLCLLQAAVYAGTRGR